MLQTVLASMVAVLSVLVFGLGLARASSQFAVVRGFTDFLTEARVALLPIFLAPILLGSTDLAPLIVVGLVVGIFQTLALNRWVARRSEEWNPALLSRLALGRSATALFTQRARSRGAVIATLGATSFEVVILEALLCLLGLSEENTIGRALAEGAEQNAFLAIAALGSLALGLEVISARLLQRKQAR